MTFASVEPSALAASRAALARLTRGRTFDHAITDAADGMDVGTGIGQFLSQPLHMGVQGAAGDFRVVAPHLGEQFTAIADLSRYRQKMQKQTHLKCADVNLAAVDEDLVGVGVNLEVAKGDAAFAGPGAPYGEATRAR